MSSNLWERGFGSLCVRRYLLLDLDAGEATLYQKNLFFGWRFFLSIDKKHRGFSPQASQLYSEFVLFFLGSTRDVALTPGNADC